MCGKGFISRNHTKRHMKSLARENLYQCVLCGNIIVETSKVHKIIVWKGRLKITKWKGTKNIKPKVQKSKISQNISNILGHNLYPISVLYVVMKLIKVYYMSSWKSLKNKILVLSSFYLFNFVIFDLPFHSLVKRLGILTIKKIPDFEPKVPA